LVQNSSMDKDQYWVPKNDKRYPTGGYTIHGSVYTQRQLGCPRNKQTKNFDSNRNKPKQDLFRLCFGLFCETKNKQFWFVSVCFGESNLYRNNQNKQNCFETNRNNPKYSEKKTFYQTVSGGLLIVSRQSKHRNSLFRYRSETTETNSFETNRKNRKNPKFSVNIPKYTPYQTVPVVFCLFRFNRNIKSLCFDIEAKQPKQTFYFR
jgi:hypothetical protein